MRTAGLRGSAAACAVVVAACAGCSPAATPILRAPEGGTPSATATSTPSTAGSSLVLPTVTAGTPPTAGPVRPPSTVPASPPVPTTAAASFADPVTVAVAWMTQFCATDYREPINNQIQRAAAFATPAATAADLATGDTPQTYAQVQAQKLSTRCDHISAEIDPEAPQDADQVWVVVSADRTQLADDQPFQSAPLTETRAMVHVDGRWLVDRPGQAG